MMVFSIHEIYRIRQELAELTQTVEELTSSSMNRQEEKEYQRKKLLKLGAKVRRIREGMRVIIDCNYGRNNTLCLIVSITHIH